MAELTKTIIEHSHRHGIDISTVEHPASINLAEAFSELDEDAQVEFLKLIAGIDFEPWYEEGISFHSANETSVVESVEAFNQILAAAKAVGAANEDRKGDDDSADARPN